MTLQDIKDSIRAIELSRGDFERAHSQEDSLRRLFIEHVANVGPPELSEMARLVLSTERISFKRRYA